MTIQDQIDLLEYGYWANRKLFLALERLSPEQFVQPLLASHGSIRNTMVHMMNAETVWLNRCAGFEPAPALSVEDFLTSESVALHWKFLEREMRQFLEGLEEQDLARTIDFAIGGGATKLSMPLGQLLQQSANHGAHHRGQVAMLLSMHGCGPQNFDILLYFVEKQRAGL